MKALVLGGTGLIGGAVVNALVARGAEVTSYSRGHRPRVCPDEVRQIVGDRGDASAFEHTFARDRYDVVIDLICFSAADANSTVRVFGGRCEQVLFCSTVCTYGGKISAAVLIDEAFPQEPVSDYARNKVAAERVFELAARESRFAVTIIRPSHTYGPGAPLVDQLELDGVAWGRITRGQPIFCAGDGLGLWQSTHRDDCARLFSRAALNPRTYGEAYNATLGGILTWRDYYRRVAGVLGARAHLLFVPADWLVRKLPGRFAFLEGTTQFHGAYSPAKAMALHPSLEATIDFDAGARETLDDIRRRGVFRTGADDHEYERLVDEALALGFSLAEA